MPANAIASLFRGSKHDVPKCHSSLFAALEVDGAWQLLVAIESAASDAWNLFMVNDSLTVLFNRDGSPDQGNVKGLPYVSLTR